MQHGPSWEANWSSDGQEIPRILWRPNVFYRIHKCLPRIPIQSQINAVHGLSIIFLKDTF